ncbi:hypothetical protein PV325_008503 [Microctonus aethiopoides]|nr:hypothetical protein PV325_008503 [Microctonus aethiopoides]KAK0098175.1 hypothetical protein PV326_010752 [Microctonus aethiopoides]
MWLLKSLMIAALLVSAKCQKDDDVDISRAFMEVANSFFSDEPSAQGKFSDHDTVKSPSNGIASLGQIISSLGMLMSNTAGDEQGKGTNPGGLDLSMLMPALQMVASAPSANNQRVKNGLKEDEANAPSFDMNSIINIASMFMGPGNGNNNLEGIMKFLPMFMENMNTGENTLGNNAKEHDHSAHSWYMPPVIENLHIIWEHFRNSELGQTLWKNSGLAHIVGTMTDADGRIQYDLILESFETPSIRRRWIKSLTNFVADWISHISDPNVQQRYITTMQFVGNSFLKSQGFPKSTLFDPTRPAESFTRMVNAGAKRYLNANFNSAQYIKPAVAYVQDLIKLASEKGFIMSRINANELSNRLSDTINNDIVSPILKTYRAYKWAIKSPKCATHIMCIINDKTSNHNKESTLRRGLTKLSSFPAAWAISTKTNISFWSLYGAIQESEQCYEKYPADCNEFHEEEIRVTTEAIHSEL